MKKPILSINSCAVYKFENHRVNGDADKHQKEIDGKSCISGQKIKHMLFDNMKDLVRENGVNDKISCSDAKTGDISTDIGSDLGGFMKTEKETKSNTRKSPINTAVAVAMNNSQSYDDLFVRFSNFENSNENEKQRINTQTYSVLDIIPINHQLNCDEVGVEKYFRIEDNKFLKEIQLLCISNEEKIKRIVYFIESVNGLNGLANTSRNAVENTPKQIFISFDIKRKFIKYFEMSENEQLTYLSDLENRGVKWFMGDSERKCGKSVDTAVDEAVQYVLDNQKLFCPIEYSQELIDERNKYIETNLKKKPKKEVVSE